MFFTPDEADTVYETYCYEYGRPYNDKKKRFTTNFTTGHCFKFMIKDE